MCKNTVIGWVNGREVAYSCGDADHHSRRVMCDTCYSIALQDYPQGWRHVPGDTCKHGVFVGTMYIEGGVCGKCEDGL